MKNTWSDILEIAIDLAETFPEVDPKWISFLICIKRYAV